MSARKNVSCGSHSRSYHGHTNVQTIKDVNYFGLQDEYVVSGSDCGHVFVWDRKSTKIVSILHADEDVVNVIEPHPYEPMIAVSGIDYTVKVFSADAKERRRAAIGKGIYTHPKQRSEAPTRDGFRLLGYPIDEEGFSGFQDWYVGGSNGLATRRRWIDHEDDDDEADGIDASPW
jgi:WD40 repeat protein